MKTERVIAYIDGFNLYFGLKDKGWRCYYWLNVRLLCQRLTKSPQQLMQVKYFTSRISSPPDKSKRQSTYIDALNTIQGIKPFYGKYQLKPVICEQCQYQNNIPEEKMTDVQISTEMLADAFDNNFDTAFLISADRDLVPIIEKIREKFSNKRVVVIFPPLRTNEDLRRIAHAYLHIPEPLLKESMLPDEIPTLSGYVLKRPTEWY